MNGRLLARSDLLQHCRFVFVDDEVPGLGLPGTPALAGGWGDRAVVTRVSGRWMGLLAHKIKPGKEGCSGMGKGCHGRGSCRVPPSTERYSSVLSASTTWTSDHGSNRRM